MQAKRNLAHRMGRWSGTHPKTAIFGWIAFVLIAFFVGNLVGTKTLDQSETGVGESGRAAKTLHDAGFEEPRRRDRCSSRPRTARSATPPTAPSPPTSPRASTPRPTWPTSTSRSARTTAARRW